MRLTNPLYRLAHASNIGPVARKGPIPLAWRQVRRRVDWAEGRVTSKLFKGVGL